MAFDIEGDEESLKKNGKQALVLALIDIRDNFKTQAVKLNQMDRDWGETQRELSKVLESDMETSRHHNSLVADIRASLLTALAMKGFSENEVYNKRNIESHPVERKLDKLLAHVGEESGNVDLPEDVLLILHLLEIVNNRMHKNDFKDMCERERRLY